MNVSLVLDLIHSALASANTLNQFYPSTISLLAIVIYLFIYFNLFQLEWIASQMSNCFLTYTNIHYIYNVLLGFNAISVLAFSCNGIKTQAN